MRYSKWLLALALLAPSLAFAQAPQINDVQLRPGSSTLWGAAFNTDNNQVISQYNTAGSVVDSFCWYQGASVSAAVKNFCTGPTGSVFGAATGGSQGAGTINAVAYYSNGSIIGFPGGTSGQIQYNNAGAFGGFTTSGDATINTASGALTLATVNANVGSFGSATNCAAFTTNAKGLITAASAVTCTPAIASITGLGTGIATALATNVGSAGAPVLFNGAGGTPTSMVGTNITGVPISTGVSGLGTGIAAALAANTGSAGAPVLFNGALGTPTSGTLTNTTGLPISTGVSGLGTGVATALAIATGANAGSFIIYNGAAGTPSALVGTNITGTAAGLTAGTFSAGSATNLTSGTLPAARTNGHMNGTATNDNAAAGEVGEFMSNGASPALTTAVSANCGQLSLTAGDWDVYASGIFSGAGATNTTNTILGINNVSATMPAFTAFQYFQFRNSAGITDFAYAPTVGPFRVSITGAAQTWYCVAQAVFTVSTFSFQGTLRARRVR